jgi:hypothetical protein
MGEGRGRVNPAPRRTAARCGVKQWKTYTFFFDILFAAFFGAV